jgi:hypothetical protein
MASFRAARLFNCFRFTLAIVPRIPERAYSSTRLTAGTRFGLSNELGTDRVRSETNSQRRQFSLSRLTISAGRY